MLLDGLSMTNMAALTLPEFGVPFPRARHTHGQGFILVCRERDCLQIIPPYHGLQYVVIITNNCSQCLSDIIFGSLTPLLLPFVLTCVEGNMLSTLRYLLSSEWRLSRRGEGAGGGQAGAVTPSQTVSLSAHSGS